MEQFALLIGLTIALIAHIVSVIVREKRYNATIDRLTDKLMAKDYREYTTLNAPVKPVKPQKPPMSWFDDPQDEDDSAH